MAALDLRTTTRGVALSLRVHPGAKRDAICGPHGAALKIQVSCPPERGKANEAVVALLADALDVSASAIEIVSGHGSRNKTVLLRGLDAQTIERALLEKPA